MSMRNTFILNLGGNKKEEMAMYHRFPTKYLELELTETMVFA